MAPGNAGHDPGSILPLWGKGAMADEVNAAVQPGFLAGQSDRFEIISGVLFEIAIIKLFAERFIFFANSENKLRN